ncbi:hypothetical protein [Saccharomonospora sp. CUA-673]|uniref:hypothetical protein n=1 Tax=Saccharomonospora sp. CUA-673 TaxID=1904969 RepID=UPI0011152C14|nr:hypothetical protein [Saccharomonospora sp. CUA-673]
MLVFSTPEEAWAACGPYQPLSAISMERVEAVANECGASAVVRNGWLDEDARHRTPVQDRRSRARDDNVMRIGELGE